MSVQRVHYDTRCVENQLKKLFSNNNLMHLSMLFAFSSYS